MRDKTLTTEHFYILYYIIKSIMFNDDITGEFVHIEKKKRKKIQHI